jgi:hypothetical protein
MPEPVVDREAQQEFARRMVGIYTGAVLTKLVDLGTQVGLFEAAAAGSATCAGLARRAGLQGRYVREWLGAMVAGGIFEYDPSSGSYELPRERAELLSGSSARNLAPMSHGIDHFGKHLYALAECFRSGGGVPYSEFRPEFTERMDDLWRRVYDEQLVDGFLGAAPGLRERLCEGILVADIGCGTGHAANLVAREYPSSRFVGYDIGEDAITAARGEAQAMGLDNIRFEVLDVRQLPTEPRLDLITAFDAIHDQAQSDTVLRSVRAAWGDDGTFLMIEFKFSSNLEANLGNPFAALYYGISTMHCLTVSLAEGGAGLDKPYGERNSPARCSRTPGLTTSTLSTHPARKTASSSAGNSHLQPAFCAWTGAQESTSSEPSSELAPQARSGYASRSAAGSFPLPGTDAPTGRGWIGKAISCEAWQAPSHGRTRASHARASARRSERQASQ